MEGLKFKAKKPKLARELMLGKKAAGDIKVVTFFRNEFELIDIFIENPIDFDKIYKKRKIFKAGKIEIPTVPYDTLIPLKKLSGRERDLIDMGYLEKLRRRKK